MKQSLALIGLFALSCSAFAAEVQGTISDRMDRGAQNATVTVTCGDFNKTVYTAMSGDYYIRHVPDNAACSLTIEWQNVRSKPHQFKTTSGATTFSRRVEPYEGKLVFIK